MAEVDAGAVAPVVPVTPAPGAQPVDAPSAPTGTGEQQESVQAERNYSEQEMRKVVADRLRKEQRRIERSVRAEVERDYFKQQLEQREKPQAQAQPTGKPDYKDFKDFESYNEALTDWKVDQRLKAEREARQKHEQASHAERADAEVARTLQGNFKASAEKHADFHDVVTADGLPFYKGSPMVQFFAKSKVGGEIAYHLGNDPDEAHRIASLHPIDQVLELKELESKLTAPPKASAAPAPIVPNGTQGQVRKDYRDMSTAEHIAQYRRDKASKNRR